MERSTKWIVAARSTAENPAAGLAKQCIPGGGPNAAYGLSVRCRIVLEDLSFRSLNPLRFWLLLTMLKLSTKIG